MSGGGRASDSLEAPPIGPRLVSDFIGSLGDLHDKSLEQVTGEVLPDDDQTSLIRRATRAWKTPPGGFLHDLDEARAGMRVRSFSVRLAAAVFGQGSRINA